MSLPNRRFRRTGFKSTRLLNPIPIPASGVAADFEVFSYNSGADVDLHDLSSTSASGAIIKDGLIDWGDGTIQEYMMGAYAMPQRTAWLNHSYKTPGTKNITFTSFDSLGNSAQTVKQFTVDAVDNGDLDIPWGRLFNGVDKFPGVNPALIPYGQPFKYIDTTWPTVNPANVRTAANETELNAHFTDPAFNATGGHIYLTGNINNWRCPGRPLDSNGVRYNTTITIQTDASLLPVGSPAPYERMTPAIGEQLIHFFATSSGQGGGGIDFQINQTYCYNIRISQIAVTIDVNSYENVRTGGCLIQMAEENDGITFDRIYTYLPAEEVTTKGCRRDIYGGGKNVALIDSWCWGNRDNSTDSQAFAIFSGKGPIKLVNNFLMGGECFLIGGARPVDGTNPEIPNHPGDIEVRRNHLWRPSEWCLFNPRKYNSGGKLLASDVQVASHDTTTRVVTFASPIPIPDGTFAWPNPSSANRLHYMFYVRSGTGAGQYARVSAFNSTTQVTLVSNVEMTTQLDSTSRIEIRFKPWWITKNNGELKTGRRVWWSENVAENGCEGDGQQYHMFLFKTTVNSATDYHPAALDVTIIDNVLINALGGINFSALPVEQGRAFGQPCRRAWIKNNLMIGGNNRYLSSAGLNSWGYDKAHAIFAGCDQVRVESLTAIDFPYGVNLFFHGYTDTPGNYGIVRTKMDDYVLKGMIATAPKTPHDNAEYWFNGHGDLDLASSTLTGNAIIGIPSIPSSFPGSWVADPATDISTVFVNPNKLDIWGTADYSIQAGKTALIAATPDRLDWTRLKQRTAGVRADPSIVPYEWD